MDEDVRCPFCKQAESFFGATNKEYADAGKIQVHYRLVDLIDRNGGGQGSLVGGATLACAADVGQAQFIAFHDLIYKNQPDETDDAYGTRRQHAQPAEPGPESAQRDLRRVRPQRASTRQWIKDNYTWLSKKLGGSVGTPDIYIDGTSFTAQGHRRPSPATQQTATTGPRWTPPWPSRADRLRVPDAPPMPRPPRRTGTAA